MESVVSPEEDVKLNTPLPATHLNIHKSSPSLEESWKTAVVRSVANNNAGSECNNEIITETEESDDGIMKPSSPLGM